MDLDVGEQTRSEGITVWCEAITRRVNDDDACTHILRAKFKKSEPSGGEVLGSFHSICLLKGKRDV